MSNVIYESVEKLEARRYWRGMTMFLDLRRA